VRFCHRLAMVKLTNAKLSWEQYLQSPPGYVVLIPDLGRQDAGLIDRDCHYQSLRPIPNLLPLKDGESSSELERFDPHVTQPSASLRTI
jgi:hypothetical protein